MIVLDGLIPIYKEIKRRSETYCIFPFTRNKVDFDIFFDIDKNPFKLGFLVAKSNFQLWLDIHQGFRISTLLDPNDLKKLKDLLGLKYDSNNPFSTNSFFEEFNRKIPNQIPTYEKEYRDGLILYSHPIEESDKPYFDGLIEWDKIGSDKKRSAENLEKTRLLFPKLYNQIKARNVSIRFSATKSKRVFQTKALNFFLSKYYPL